MSEAQLRQWVEANPEKVNDTDKDKLTPLYAAVRDLKSLSLVLWLLDEKGADVDAQILRGQTVLAKTDSLDILNALLNRGADPTIPDFDDMSPIMHHAGQIRGNVLQRLLGDPGVRATVDKQDRWRNDTALHHARFSVNPFTRKIPVIRLLLQGGASPKITNKFGQQALSFLQNVTDPDPAAIVFLEEVQGIEKTSLLVKAHRIGFVSRNFETIPDSPGWITRILYELSSLPSYLHDRVWKYLQLPSLVLQRVRLPNNATKKGRETGGEERRKLRNLVAFVIGMEGGLKGEGMPPEVFHILMSLLRTRCEGATLLDPCCGVNKEEEKEGKRKEALRGRKKEMGADECTHEGGLREFRFRNVDA